jgi:hypothetical protein
MLTRCINVYEGSNFCLSTDCTQVIYYYDNRDSNYNCLLIITDSNLTNFTHPALCKAYLLCILMSGILFPFVVFHIWECKTQLTHSSHISVRTHPMNQAVSIYSIAQLLSGLCNVALFQSCNYQREFSLKKKGNN